MDAENDNNEQGNSSSASSSNNSSNSNLLANLPMLPMLHGHDDDDEPLEEQMPLHPPSPPPALARNDQQLQQQISGTAAGQLMIPDNSIFISPLLFNNNTSPPPSSSSSSSSSTTHNLHLYHHHNHQQEQDHIEHAHHQHSPRPSSHQQHAPTPSSSQELRRQQNTIDDNAIADTIDASAVEAAAVDINVNADIASTSGQQQLSGITSEIAARALVGTHSVSNTSPTSLPLLLHEEPKQTHSYASHYSSHSYVHPYQQQHQPHNYHHHYHTNFGGCSNIFGFEATNSNGANMLSGNDNNGVPQTSASGSGHHHQTHQMMDRLKMLYPNVNENETPLPRCWSPHDKCLAIGLSQNNLRVHYKGAGKQHNDAASVRTAYPIPPACGLYYFEVKILSKGKNGYMGIGLTAQQFRMNRLPGWDKQSYGYHGDDGNSFSSSGNGQLYGPTFTTGDIIGCCVNFVNNTCFYTKNGMDLGIAFRDLPTKLYPTVGLQTPGEEVNANFGQEPFKFDQIEDMMKQMHAEMKTTIYNFPIPADQGDPTTLMHKMVLSYLVHNGYSQTAEAFGRTTGQSFNEEPPSIRNRQKISKLVMSGKMGQAIEHTLRSYPGLLENNKNLWFMLKCRQFIEMVNGSDLEYCPTNNKITNSITTQTQITPPNQTSVIQSTKLYQNGKSAATTATTTTTTSTATTTTTNTAVINTDNQQQQEQDLKSIPSTIEQCAAAGDGSSISKSSGGDVLTANVDYLNDVDMENSTHTTNGNSCKNGNFNISLDVDEEMDIDMSPSARKYCHGIERILDFGKELSQMGQQLEKDNKMNDEDRQMLEDAFSLIAYSNPWSSPLGWQLCPSKRETVCTALNSAILESMNYPRRPPLDVCIAHTSELLKVMAQASIGACAFINIEDIFPQN